MPEPTPDKITMTRTEAISHIWGLSGQVEGEFCVGPSESEELDSETRAALTALGVTSSEMNPTEDAPMAVAPHWFAEFDDEGQSPYLWVPCLETGEGHMPHLNVWFETKRACDEWIDRFIVGAGSGDTP